MNFSAKNLISLLERNGYSYFLSSLSGKIKSLSATRKIGTISALIYNTLSATRKILRRRLSIVVKSSHKRGIPRRG